MNKNCITPCDMGKKSYQKVDSDASDACIDPTAHKELKKKISLNKDRITFDAFKRWLREQTAAPKEGEKK